MDLGLLHCLPEGELSRRKLSARLLIRWAIIVERVFDRGIEVQASQSPQLALAETMIAEVLHDAAYFGSGRQGSISGP